MNRPPDTKDYIALENDLAKRRSELEAGKKKLDALERKLNPQVLARNPAAVGELATAKVSVQLLSEAIEAAEQTKRELAAASVPYGFYLYRRARALSKENREIVFAGLRRRVGKFFDETQHEFIFNYSAAAIAESFSDASTPLAQGDPTATELHPDQPAQQIIDAILALERHIAAAEERQTALKHEFA